MKVALVHDHFFEFGGAERVFLALKRIFPDAEVYTAAYHDSVLKKNAPDYKNWKIHTSWAAHIPFFSKLYSPLRFLAPWIWESFNFSQYDVVISSSGWFMSKGIITRPETLHISYVHHQPRYLYYYETAVEWQKYLIIKIYAHFINHFLRMWDFVSSQRPNLLVANSEETKKRIKKFYRRDAQIIYPPISIPVIDKNSLLQIQDKKYYITLSRLTKTKNLDVLIKAANMQKFQLKIVGSGRDEQYLKSIAGNTVKFLGHIDDKEFETLYKGAKAFLFASVDEEFGIAPVEAMSYGVPVIAYASGGLKEIIKDGKNGYLYKSLDEKSLIEMMIKFEQLSEKEYQKMSVDCIKESLKYSEDVFSKEIQSLIKKNLRDLS